MQLGDKNKLQVNDNQSLFKVKSVDRVGDFDSLFFTSKAKALNRKTIAMSTKTKMGRTTHNSQKSETSVRSQEVSKLNEGFLETSKSIKENITGINEILNMEDKSTEEKFDWVARMISKIDKRLTLAEENIKKGETKFETAVFDPEDGLGVVYQELKGECATNLEKVEGLTKQLEEEKEQREKFQKQVQKNTKEMAYMKGLIQKQYKQIHSLQSKVTDVVARGMEDNLILSGLYEETGEDLVDRVATFLYDNMNIDARYQDIGEVYCMGSPAPGKIRPILFQCAYNLRKHILDNTSRLRNIGNGNGGFFFISQQLPEAYVAEKKNLAYSTKLAKDKNKSLPKKHKARIEIKNKKLYVNAELVKQKVLTPKPVEIFVDDDEQEQMDKIKFFSSNPKTEKGSQFITAAVKVSTSQELTRAYRKAIQMYTCADHVMMAANIQKVPCFQDDGEYNSSAKIHSIIMDRKVDNIALFVIRNYGGRHLGPTRFECISHVANEALASIMQNQDLDELVFPTPPEDDGSDENEGKEENEAS